MPEVDALAFGKRVAARRTKLGLSQPELARRVGMRQQGVLAIEKGKVRRPRLLRELVRALRTTEEWLLWKEGPEEIGPPATDDLDITRVPLVSWVSAGRLSEANSQIPVEDVPLLAFADLGRGDYFALKVVGDSMDRISPDGSTIIVDRSDRQLVPGRPYVFSIRGEATYKRWRPTPDRLDPFSTNPMNEPIFVQGKRSFGVVGRVRRTVLDL